MEADIIAMTRMQEQNAQLTKDLLYWQGKYHDDLGDIKTAGVKIREFWKEPLDCVLPGVSVMRGPGGGWKLKGSLRGYLGLHPQDIDIRAKPHKFHLGNGNYVDAYALGFEYGPEMKQILPGGATVSWPGANWLIKHDVLLANFPDFFSAAYDYDPPLPKFWPGPMVSCMQGDLSAEQYKKIQTTMITWYRRVTPLIDQFEKLADMAANLSP